MSEDLRFEHVLSEPEHIWLAFFRAFFTQKTLMFGPGDDPLPNNFLYDETREEANRRFDVVLVADYDDANIARLPAVVIEDLSVSQQGVLLDQRQSWTVVANRGNYYRDLNLFNYALHCVSKDRGESRLLAGIVWKAINVFKDVLYQSGIHQITPRSASNTQQIRAPGKEDRVDTVVSFQFWMQEFWGYKLVTNIFPEQFCFFEAFEERTKYILGRMELAFAARSKYILSRMDLTDPSTARYVLGQEELVDPLNTSSYVLGQAELADPSTTERFIRGHMRVVA